MIDYTRNYLQGMVLMYILNNHSIDSREIQKQYSIYFSSSNAARSSSSLSRASDSSSLLLTLLASSVLP